jgi:signal peptidase I
MAIGLALLIQAFIVKPYQIPSESMEPTLDPGQRVLVNRFGYRFGEPSIGDVVVFNPPVGAVPGERADRGEPLGGPCGVEKSPEQACPEPHDEEASTNFIKRIVAGPGDRLQIEDGIPIVNGEPTQEENTIPCRGGGGCQFPEEIVIPPDHYFMMGDNRGHSDDSRFWGPVPRESIIGQAFFTYWPINRVGLL